MILKHSTGALAGSGKKWIPSRPGAQISLAAAAWQGRTGQERPSGSPSLLAPSPGLPSSRLVSPLLLPFQQNSHSLSFTQTSFVPVPLLSVANSKCLLHFNASEKSFRPTSPEITRSIRPDTAQRPRASISTWKDSDCNWTQQAIATHDRCVLCHASLLDFIVWRIRNTDSKHLDACSTRTPLFLDPDNEPFFGRPLLDSISL